MGKMIMNKKTYKWLSWDSTDLLASKNAAKMIEKQHGEDTVLKLAEKGYFGNLDIDSVLDECFKANFNDWHGFDPYLAEFSDLL